MTDYYQILGVPRDADTYDIKTAYRRKAQSIHPDKGGGVDEFAQLSEAYRVLSDPALRARYDRGEDATKQPMSLEAQARERLAQMFSTFIQKVRPDQDLVDMMHQALLQGKSNLDEEERKAKASLANIEKLRKRMHYKGADPQLDIFTNVLNGMEQANEKALENMAREREIQDRVLELLEDYACDVEVRTATERSHLYMPTGTSTWP